MKYTILNVNLFKIFRIVFYFYFTMIYAAYQCHAHRLYKALP